MEILLFLAGLLALLAAGVHGIGGQVLVLRKLFQGALPSTWFGGPAMTKSMVYVTWHITTFAFFAAGVGMVVSAAALEGDAADAVAISSAVAFTGFAAIATGLGAAKHPPRAMLQHPGPIVLAATAALAWLGAV